MRTHFSPDDASAFAPDSIAQSLRTMGDFDVDTPQDASEVFLSLLAAMDSPPNAPPPTHTHTQTHIRTRSTGSIAHRASERETDSTAARLASSSSSSSSSSGTGGSGGGSSRARGDSSRDPDSRSDSEDFRARDTAREGVGRGRGGRGPGGKGGLVEALFTGKIRAAVTCGGCGGVSVKTEAFLDLALDVSIHHVERRVENNIVLGALMAETSGDGGGATGGDKEGGGVEVVHKHSVVGVASFATTLEGSVAHYCNAQSLDAGATTYSCENCSSVCPASRQVRFQRLPPVVCMQLKRFNLRGAKIHRHVAFPLALSLESFLSDSTRTKDVRNMNERVTRQSQLSLYGVLVHVGESRGGGHYIAYIKDCHGAWWEMSDISAFQTEESHVLSQQAYLLFYLRQPYAPHADRGGGGEGGDEFLSDGVQGGERTERERGRERVIGVKPPPPPVWGCGKRLRSGRI